MPNAERVRTHAVTFNSAVLVHAFAVFEEQRVDGASAQPRPVRRGPGTLRAPCLCHSRQLHAAGAGGNDVLQPHGGGGGGGGLSSCLVHLRRQPLPD